jgi:hypothetical protein
MMKSIFLILGFTFLSLTMLASSVQANGDDITDYPACAEGELKLDLGCQRERLFDHSSNCPLYYCEGQGPSNSGQETIQLNFFGVRINLSSGSALQQLAFVIISLFLGVVAIFLSFIGIYAAVKRSQAEKDEDLQKANKMLTNALAGLAIMAVSLVIAQLTASFLGVGSLAQIVDFSCLANSAGENCK